MHSSHRLLARLLVVAAVLAVVAAAAGCSTPDEAADDYVQPGTTELVVERLQFDGVENVSERGLRQGLATIEDPGWRADSPWHRLPVLGDRRQFFNHFAWRQDRERILAYYRQQGYYHASIQSESIIEDPEAQTVRIRVTIDEGEPTRISNIELHGLIEGVTPERETLLDDLPLREGGVFVQDDYRNVRNALRSRLRDAGHAYAEVSGRVFVDPETKEADVYFFLEPGPESEMGPVYILGLDEISEEAVRRAVPFREGERFSPELLNRTQEQIYDLGVFAMVTVLPAHEARQANVERRRDQQRLEDITERHDLPDDPDEPTREDPDIQIRDGDEPSPLGVSDLLADAQRHAESRSRLDPQVPIVIRVQEATGYNLRVGAGLAAEGTRQDVRGLLDWSSRNFLGGLRRLQHFNAAGYAWSRGLIGPGELVNRGLILSSELRFQQPQFIESRTNLRMRARVQRDVQEGFTVWNPSYRIALERTFGRHFMARASYNAAYFNYSNVDPGLIDPTATELGLDFQTEFLFEYFEQSLAYDRRNDVINPSAGWMVDLTVQQAGNYAIGGEFDFVKPVLSAEHYIPTDLFGRSVLAIRGRIGSIYNYGQESRIPIQSRLYSGGADGMRSFGRRRLSLYTASGRAVPVGGLSQVETSVEPRFRLAANFLDVGDLWGAVFLDAATVMRGQFLFDTGPNPHGISDFATVGNSMLYGLGAGAWWNTPVGPVRLDVARTLSDLSGDHRFRRCEDPQDYMTEACEFVPRNDDPIQDMLQRFGLYLSIGHSF